jgi:hypothetical protein
MLPIRPRNTNHIPKTEHIPPETAKTPAAEVLVKRQPSKTLNAKIFCSDSYLLVENIGRNTWEDIEMYLNGEPPNTYRFHLGVLQPNYEYKVSLREFSMEDGKRFDPAGYKVTAIWMGGGKYDYKPYGFGIISYPDRIPGPEGGVGFDSGFGGLVGEDVGQDPQPGSPPYRQRPP